MALSLSSQSSSADSAVYSVLSWQSVSLEVSVPLV